jgi:hypothetical protein
VSIFGSLSPNFQLSNGITLAEDFEGKLIIVLDDQFKPLEDEVASMNPSCMLPNGSERQTSGFHSTTMWLLVGSSEAAVKQSLTAHYTAPSTDLERFQCVSDFFSNYRKQLESENLVNTTLTVPSENISSQSVWIE